jgi:type I restriction enzyme M protein
MSLIDQGIAKGYIKFDDERKFITYVYPGKKYRYSDPEEKVRAEIFLQIIIEYGYNAKRIELELTVPRRTPSDSADIVIFSDDGKKKPYIVVECKAPIISEAEFVQAIEQGFGNAVSLGAEWVWVTSGIKSRYYSIDRDRPLERITNIQANIPKFGKTDTSKAKYYYGGVDEDGDKAFDLEKVEQENLTRIFGQAHQALWAGGKRNPSEAFDELDKLIFCKLWDEKKARKEGEPYDFQEYKKEDPEFLLKRIKAIYELGRLKDPEVFREPIRLSASELKTIVGYLAPLNIGETDLDSKGRAFETFLGSFFRGDFGQYFTPREVVDFVVKVLPIKNDSLVLDTSCGSGGFLLYALDKVRKQADVLYPKYETDTKQKLRHYQYWHDFAQYNLYGIEISESIARTAKMNMIIHDDGHTNVVTADGLLSADYRTPQHGETDEEKEAREKWNSQTIQTKTGNNNFKYDHFDFIITNPPFGSTIKLTEQAYLRNYNLGLKEINWIERKHKHKFDLGPRDSQSTEILFIEHCQKFLCPGGILAIVVPDGILTNSTSQPVRDWIEEHYRIISVVSLPQDAFRANDAGVKSSIMFLQKLTALQTEKIQSIKARLQDNLWEKPEYGELISKLEEDKLNKLKQHSGFDYALIDWDNEGNLVNLKNIDKEDIAIAIQSIKDNAPILPSKKEGKVIEKTEEFKQWKINLTSFYNEQINDIKEKLEDEYLIALNKEVTNYPIFMAITENIGYDATGRKTGTNELDIVATELAKFISNIVENKESFFG